MRKIVFLFIILSFLSMILAWVLYLVYSNKLLAWIFVSFEFVFVILSILLDNKYKKKEAGENNDG